MARFKGLTWDHPRGYKALNAAAPSDLIEWDKQPLEGFESAPIANLCTRYDLVVLDHPHLGEAMTSDCLRALESIFPSETLAQIERSTIGPSYESYAMKGSQWALPLDAATQVLARRPDLTEDLPTTWEEVRRLSKKTGKVELSLAGPHAFLSWLSIASAIEPDCDLRDGDDWVDDDTGAQAFDILFEIYAHSTVKTHELNPIGLLNYMAQHDDVWLCPLIYGYVNYASIANEHPITFHDAPVLARGGRPGTILGGTGIAISQRCEPDEALLDHLIWLLGENAQSVFIPENEGQPSAKASWMNLSVNAVTNDFYLGTRASLENAAIRPRHDGYVAMQAAAAEHLRNALSIGADPENVARELRALFEKSIMKRSGHD